MTQETITTLAIEDVYPNPKHYRQVDPANVKLLAENIKAAGQLEAIRVFQDGDIYYVDSGHHRLAAMKQLGHETIRAIVDTGENSAAMVAANMHFAESELEKSRGTQLLLATGVRPLDAAAMTGYDQNLVTRAKRGMEIVADETACEDLTLDRLAAINDFADDPDAVKALENASEIQWRGILSNLELDKARNENFAIAEATIKAAGCTIVEGGQYGASPKGLVFMARGKDAPEGATAARLQYSDWSSSVDIVWYGEAPAEDVEKEAAASAQREQEALIASQLEGAAKRRVEYVVKYLSGETPGASNALRDLAVDLWENGDYDAESRNLEDFPDFKGFLGRVYLSILTAVESNTAMVLEHLTTPYYVNRNGADALRYLDALAECGLTPTDVESGVRAELEEALGESDE